MAAEEHRASAQAPSQIRVVVMTVSDSRTPETDDGGALGRALAERAGFSVLGRELVRDEPESIRARLLSLLAGGQADALLLTGGTGVSPRDRTVEAVTPLFEMTLDGFGELFRMLSFAEVGAAAYLSRATAGIVRGVPVFLLPGSPAAVRLALEKLILPELAHLVGQLRRTHDHGHGVSIGRAAVADGPADTAHGSSGHDHHR